MQGIHSIQKHIDIKTTNAKSVTDASIWVMFISKHSDTLEIAEHILLNSFIIIRRYGFHFRSTDLTDKAPIHCILVEFVNKPGKNTSVIEPF